MENESSISLGGATNLTRSLLFLRKKKLFGHTNFESILLLDQSHKKASKLQKNNGKPRKKTPESCVIYF